MWRCCIVHVMYQLVIPLCCRNVLYLFIYLFKIGKLVWGVFGGSFFLMFGVVPCAVAEVGVV